MPLSIFRIRLVAAANLGGFLLAGGLYGTFLMLTLYMQQVLHMSVLQTGVAFLATAGTAVLMAGPAQALTTRLGAKPVLIVGMSLLVAGCLWYTQIDANGSYQMDLLPGFFAVGIGIPFSFIPITIAALAGVSHERAGLASGLINTSQQVGGAIGTAVLSTVFITHSRTLLEERTPPDASLDPGLRVGLLGRGRDLGRGAARCDLSRAARGGRAARAGRDPRLADLSGLPVTGLNELVLEVADLDAAARFYGEVLGLPVQGRSDDRAWFLVGERSRIGLWSPQVGIAGGRGGAHVHYAMHVDEEDYEAAVARLREHALDVHEEDFEDSGRAAYVTDPDGNVVELWSWGA